VTQTREEERYAIPIDQYDIDSVAETVDHLHLEHSTLQDIEELERFLE
jgi:hypothetical protein